MKCSHRILLALLLVANLCTAQSYKGIIFGINASKIANDERFKDWFIGWHIGYAVRGDLKKQVVAQLELIASIEGGSNKAFDVRAVTCFLKMPLLMSAKLDKQSPLRAIFGIQQNFYMGGFTKLGHPIYRPYFREDDDNKYQ